MKNLELTNFGVQELDAKELKNVDGGCLGLLTLPITGFVAGYLYEKISRAIKSF